MREHAVEVIADPAEVAAARQAWHERRRRRLRELLATPSMIGSREGWDLVEADAGLALETLVTIRDDLAQPPHERLAAIYGLKTLGVAPSAEQVAAIASTSHREAMEQFLAWIEALFPHDTPPPDPIRRAIGAGLAHRLERVQQTAERLVARYRLHEFAETLLANARRGHNLRALAQMLPTQRVLDFLLAGMREWPQRDAVGCAMGLADFAQTTADAALRRRAMDGIVEFFATMKEPAGGGEIAVLDVAGEITTEAVAEEILRSVLAVTRDGNVRTAARYRLNKIEQARHRDDPADAAIRDALVRHAVITRAEADRGGADIPPRERETDFLDGLLRTLTRLGRHIILERTVEQIPYRHDLKVREIASYAVVAPHFKPEAVLEIFRPLRADDDVPGEYTLQFVHAERLYRVRPEDRGLQLDLVAVLAAVHAALADAGVADRFVAWTWDSALVQFIFAPPHPLRAAAAEFGFEMQETED